MANIQDIREAGIPPQRAYSWEISVLSDSLIGALEVLSARAMNITLPEKSHDTIEINYRSRKSRYAGRDSSPGTFTVTFWDDESGQVYNFFNNWIELGLSNSITGGGLDRSQYAAKLEATMMAHDEVTQTIKHVFDKVWPSSLGDVTLSYDTSEHASFTITFTYDTHLTE